MLAPDPQGYLSVVLHAHLPFVRHPEHARFLEEGWFFEAVTETYLPLLGVLDDLVRDQVDFRLSVVLTPTLVSMFDDDLLRSRCEAHLDASIALARRERERLRGDPELAPVIEFYVERLCSLRARYAGDWRRDLTAAFRRLQDTGHVELLASLATHALAPLLRPEPAAVEAQVRLGADHYQRSFARKPQGMWLPECAYYPGLDDLLAEVGVRYFCVDSHALAHGATRARHGVYAPVICPSGVAAFARDPESSRQVWSRDEGFPADPEYREFYRDVSSDLSLDALGDHFAPGGDRAPTGLKYYRVTGRGADKLPYRRVWALAKAAAHAREFLADRRKEIEWAAVRMDRRPIVLAPYDAELLGHWWFEGPEWLDALLRAAARDPAAVQTATPSEYLAEYPESQSLLPGESSWGEGGFYDFWINEDNDWIYPRLFRAARAMRDLAWRFRGVEGPLRQALNQAGRELLLAQSSDWSFLIRAKTAIDYARRRTIDHLDNFEKIAETIRGGAPDFDLVSALEARNKIFAQMDFEVFASHRAGEADAAPRAPAHVAFLTAELAPLVKVGGLADVAGALPQALARFGLRVTVIAPCYRSIDRSRFGVRPVREGLSASIGGKDRPFQLLEADPPAPGVRWLLVDDADYFGRDGVYTDPATKKDYPDTAERYAFFTRAALESLRALGEPVDIIHCHDHHTALAPFLLSRVYRQDAVLGRAASVYTIHNHAHQGEYPPAVLDVIGVPWSEFHPGSPFEYYGKVNWAKIGITFADKVSTVSVTYAREICEDPMQSAGLGGVLQTRRGDLWGIVNGIDVDEWNPETDKHLPVRFSAVDLAGKRDVKRALLARVGLPEAAIDAPLVGVISRLENQKGFDVVEKGLGDILAGGANLVVLGTGQARYEDLFRNAAKEHPGRVAALITFDNKLAHLIEAGADLFLMPSLYEPCGLNQLYSLRYGTIPVVRETGGLADTVVDADAREDGVGFTFRPYAVEALLDALGRALRAYRDPERWRAIVLRAMARNHSWGASALRYLDLYRAALGGRL